jgi:arylamine N-acetyltransferase
VCQPQLSALHQRYLLMLGAESAAPSLNHLRRLVRAHLQRVPFENISKLYYLQTLGLRGAPDLELYLHGIETCGFGGTCYSNNPHFFGLLQRLGYDARLCGADMSEPDVHLTIMVRLEGREYLVDMGYAAPFDRPLPRDLDEDLEIRLGNERWVLKPCDSAGRSRMAHHRKDENIHGYVAKPQARHPEYFRSVIEDSYSADATFMSSVRLVRYFDGGSLAIANLNLIRATTTTSEVQRLADRNELVQVIEQEFHIPSEVTAEALKAVTGSAL